MIRHLHVETDRVELADVDLVQNVVVATPVPRLRHATVVTDDDVLGIVRVDPHRVVVHVNALRRIARRLAAVVRHLDRCGRPVDAIGIARIDAHLGVVERARILGVRTRPRGAAILAAIEAAQGLLRLLRRVLHHVRHGVGFHLRVHDLRVRARNRDLDAAKHRGRESATRDLGPCRAGIGGLPQRRARATALQEVRAALPLVAAGPDDVGIGRIELHVDEAGAFADELDHRPRLSAVGRLVQTTRLAGFPRGPEHRHVDGVGVFRMHLDAADVLRLGQAEEAPGAAAVGALEHAAARRDGIAGVLLTGADIERVGVGRCDGHVAHRHAALVLEDRPERRAGVGGLPDTAASSRDVEGLRGRRDAFDIGDASAHVGWPDRTPADGGQCH